MNNNQLRRLVAAVEKGTSIGLVALMGMLSYLVLPVTASAADLTTESTALSDPTISHAATTYTITQSGVSLSPIMCIKVLFSVNADGTGSIPVGMSITGATYNAAGSTYVPDVQTWVASGNNGTGVVSITNATGETPASAGPDAIVLTGITNGSTANTSYFTTVSTYNNTDCATSPVDVNGQSAYVFTAGVQVSATVNPTLTFAVSTTTCPLGTLTISTTGTCVYTLTAASNAMSGYSISYASPATLTSGANTITGLTAGAASIQNTSQYGFNLRDNATPNIGTDPTGDTGYSFGAFGYGTPDSFKFTTAGGSLVTSAGPTANTVFTVTHVANISATTPAGLYTSVQTYNITATY